VTTERFADGHTGRELRTAVARAAVRGRQMRPAPEQLLPQRSLVIPRAIDAPALELGDDVLGEVSVDARGDHVPEVEPVGIGGGDPLLDAIGDLGAGLDREGPFGVGARRSMTSRNLQSPSPNVSASDWIASLGTTSSGSSRW
jgi:hypothetical protein